MIETTVDTIDGVQFLKDIRIVEPIEKRHGVPVELVSWRLADNNPEFIRALKLLGLKKIDFDPSYRADVYAKFPISYIRLKITMAALHTYWAIIRWLYNNARVFKQIPENGCFSWRYFTPYTWFNKK